jgi:BlaI family transcriptional regulator, penicillinase repressor
MTRVWKGEDDDSISIIASSGVDRGGRRSGAFFILCASTTLPLSDGRRCLKVIARQRPLKEATIRTVLRRLEQKGYLTHDAEGRAYVYRAVESRHNLAARAVRQIIDRFCRGSVEELVSGMVDAKLLTKAELETLGGVVRQRRRQATGQDAKKGR